MRRSQASKIGKITALFLAVFAFFCVFWNGSHRSPVLAAPSEASTANGATLALYQGQAEDNTPFSVGNMFPGDAETKTFRVEVSRKSSVTVHFRADVRPGYEKLAEVLKARVVLSGGEVLYDGLMRDMPQSVDTALTGAGTDVLTYEITASLDTSVTNEYQNRDLVADFRWWVTDTDALAPSPKTSDTLTIALWTALAAGSVGVLIVIARRRRKEESHG